MSSNNQRKKLIVNKAFQYKFIIKVFLSIFLMSFVLSSGILYFNYKALKTAKATAEITTRSFLEEYKNVSNPYKVIDFTKKNLVGNIFKIFVLTSVLSLIVVFIVFRILTHRIAGPIYRFERTLKSFADGDISIRIILRDKDELQELAQSFNHMAISLNNNFNQIKKLADSMSTKTKDNSISEDINKLKQILENYKIADN